LTQPAVSAVFEEAPNTSRPVTAEIAAPIASISASRPRACGALRNSAFIFENASSMGL
jgi:hypothetical protein